MSEFVVSARKYRPTQFKDVVGQTQVTRTLQNAIEQNKLAHAFLFCGPRGVGKTSCARILAKSINCTEISKESIEPCGACPSCVDFDRHASLNIVELDAASNNSVEHIRLLVDQVRIPPQQGKYKVFIIDEVHMLSAAAFNAFLKTLEEPPAYAIFILATTEKHKILPTILSRCQIFDFRRIKSEDMVAHLASICAAEDIKYDEEALHLVAQKADGALRDALSIFDRLANHGNQNVEYNDALDLLNVVDNDFFFALLDKIKASEVQEVLAAMHDLLMRGFEGSTMLLGLMEVLRNLLIAQYDTVEHLLDLSDAQKRLFYTRAKELDRDFILTLLDMANEADVLYRQAENKRLHVEMCLIKMCYYQDAVEITETKKKTT